MHLKLQPGRKRLADYKSERPNMSKPISWLLLGLMLLSLGTATLLPGNPAAASVPQAASAATSSTRNAAIVAATQAILKETSVLRELPILRPVKSGAQSRTDIERMVIRNLEEQTTPAEMHASERFLHKMGLVPPGFRYRPFVIALLTEQVAGYYDPKAQQFFLADWIELEGQKPVMAHELTHALQDQHFNLRRFEKWPAGDSDAQLAAHALIEGDASLAMTIYMARNPLVGLAFMRSLGSSNTPSQHFKQAPRALRETLVFPYEKGTEWATNLYKRGGWKLISEAFNKLPLSTEQILHPEKYFANEEPIKVSLPDLGGLLGTGWKRIDYDVNGEWGLYLILDEFLKAPAESRRAAAGWGGDRYALYEGPQPGDVLLLQMTVWDTEHDAREFFDTYQKRVLARYRDAEKLTLDLGEQQLKLEGWQTSEGAVIVELRGDRVLIAEGLPKQLEPQALLKTLWQ